MSEPRTKAGKAFLIRLLGHDQPFLAGAEVEAADALDVERLARALDATPGLVTSSFGFTREEHLRACREIAPTLVEKRGWRRSKPNYAKAVQR